MGNKQRLKTNNEKRFDQNPINMPDERNSVFKIKIVRDQVS